MLEGLSVTGKREDTNELIKILRKGNYVERMNAISRIKEIEDERAVAPLVFMLNDDGGRLQSSAMDALIKMGDMAVGPMLECWPSLSRDTQKCLTYVLMAIGSEKATEALTALMEGRENQARREAARALGLLGGKRAAGSLIKALKDDNYALRNAAYEALDNVDPDDIDLATVIGEVEAQCMLNEMGTFDVIRKMSEKIAEEPASITVTVGGTMKQKLMLLARGHQNEADYVRYPEAQLRFVIYVWRMMKIAQKKMA